MAHIDVRDLGRVTTITTVLARHGFGSLLAAAGLSSYVQAGDHQDDGSDYAVRLRRVLVELGPTFVKLGQVLSVRPDIVPQGLIVELSKLQDTVPPVSWEQARQVIEEELDGPLDQVFTQIQETPVASASMAQVHFATLKDGREVAIKVQRPGIHKLIRSDVHILYTMAALVEGRLDLPGVYTPRAIVKEFESAINSELDFTHEARNAERFRECFLEEPDVIVPRIYRRFTSSRMMVMERVHGTPLSHLDQHDKRMQGVVQQLVESTVSQVFDHGFFHADPHPGNLIVTDRGQLAFLDFGLCGSLTAQMRETLVTVLVALVFQDAETLALSLYHAGAINGRVDLRAFKGEIERLLQKYHGASLADLSTQASLVEFIEAASRFQIRLTPEYALLARAGSIIDGILRSRVPETDPVELVRPHARRLMTDRLSPERMGSDAMRLFVQAQGGFRQLPTQLNQLLLDVERGQLRVVVEPTDGQALREEISTASFRLSLALTGAAMLVAGALLVSSASTIPGLPYATGTLGLLALIAAASVFGVLLAHTLLGRQLSLATLKRRGGQIWRFFRGSA
ncbi:MAG: AarF/ABC1/UbiB kinase family protein [Myxococcota bacterium]|nr:AarF/ABC1/UbiB kinase family protein [Myxococcota bacterium]